nr:hypothetical protein BaRGS_006486 [Batillaria attramentaria]
MCLVRTDCGRVVYMHSKRVKGTIQKTALLKFKASLLRSWVRVPLYLWLHKVAVLGMMTLPHLLLMMRWTRRKSRSKGLMVTSFNKDQEMMMAMAVKMILMNLSQRVMEMVLQMWTSTKILI